jgi:hypothetical protein
MEKDGTSPEGNIINLRITVEHIGKIGQGRDIPGAL